ncbi:MAG: FxsA family protein, partial [Methylobacter sp.]
MKNFQILFLAILIIPFAEIYLLIQVGGIIGAFPTILLVV